MCGAEIARLERWWWWSAGGQRVVGLALESDSLGRSIGATTTNTRRALRSERATTHHQGENMNIRRDQLSFLSGAERRYLESVSRDVARSPSLSFSTIFPWSRILIEAH